MACCSKKVAKVTLVLSVLLLALSIGLIFIFQYIYNHELRKDTSLTNGSIVAKIWEDIPLPIYEKLYFFNITNEDAFLAGTEPLNVTEVGPYTYKSRWVKPNPQWNDNYTVSYKETRTYQFVPHLSVGSEDDTVYTLNGPLIIGANVIPKLFLPAFDIYCRYEKENVVIKKSIRDLAYQGYDDPIIKRARILKPNLPYKDGKFSWLYGKNATDDGLFTVFTGVDDQSKTDIINKWNGQEKLNFWKGDSCNMLNGTSIELGPPIEGPQDSYSFYQTFFCRSLTYNFTEDVKHFGIKAKRFRPTYDLFANSTVNPDNHCFEVTKQRPSGILDLSPCQFEAPVFVSYPHFHLADSSYLKSVNGLNPDDEKHGSHIDVEFVTGLSIDIDVRFQINIEIQELVGFSLFKDVTKGVFPVFWAELSLKIDEDLSNFLKHKVRDPKIIAYSVIGILFLVGCIGVIVSVVVLCKSRQDDEMDLLIKEKMIPCVCESNICTEKEKLYSEEKVKKIENNESLSIVNTDKGSINKSYDSISPEANSLS